MTCPHCGRQPDQWHREVMLLVGGPSCNFAPAWAEECRRRDPLARRILRMIDREDCLRALADHEAQAGAESAARLKAAVLGLWHLSHSTTNQGAA